jgi:hypothetical protein
VVTHEYTHVAQIALAQSLEAVSPSWLSEGQAVHLEEQGSGLVRASLIQVGRAQIEQRGASLAQLSRPRSWRERELADGTALTYAHAHAAVRFLAERHGFEATVQLLRDGRRGSPERFEALLRGLTGLNATQRETAFANWLANHRLLEARDEQSAARLELSLAAELSGEAVVTFERDLSCGPGHVVLAGTRRALRLEPTVEGGFGGRSVAGDEGLWLEGQVVGGELQASLTYANLASTCATSPLRFGLVAP